MSSFVDVEDPFDPEQQAEVERANKIVMDDAMRAVADEIEARKLAYIHVFARGTPSDEDRRIVMEDLARFCRGGTTPWHENDRIHCLLTGRHEVFVRVSEHINLNTAQLVRKYTTKPGV